MTNEQLAQILATLDTIEIKGYDNINKMFGVMLTIKQEIEKRQQKQSKGEDLNG